MSKTHFSSDRVNLNSTNYRKIWIEGEQTWCKLWDYQPSLWMRQGKYCTSRLNPIGSDVKKSYEYFPKYRPDNVGQMFNEFALDLHHGQYKKNRKALKVFRNNLHLSDLEINSFFRWDKFGLGIDPRFLVSSKLRRHVKWCNQFVTRQSLNVSALSSLSNWELQAPAEISLNHKAFGIDFENRNAALQVSWLFCQKPRVVASSWSPTVELIRSRLDICKHIKASSFSSVKDFLFTSPKGEKIAQGTLFLGRLRDRPFCRSQLIPDPPFDSVRLVAKPPEVQTGRPFYYSVKQTYKDEMESLDFRLFGNQPIRMCSEIPDESNQIVCVSTQWTGPTPRSKILPGFVRSSDWNKPVRISARL